MLIANQFDQTGYFGELQTIPKVFKQLAGKKMNRVRGCEIRETRQKILQIKIAYLP
ncbi:MAG TPA: hypothetical protein VK308_04565 [Pyrinomonadaceae bacterium]|nr:hypothetical protein [Pyrinomonadaceae bacterium]